MVIIPFISTTDLQTALFYFIITLISVIVLLIMINLDPATYAERDEEYTDKMVIEYYVVIPLFLLSIVNLVLAYTSTSAFAPKFGQSSRNRHLSRAK